jgi:hypothetical protein
VPDSRSPELSARQRAFCEALHELTEQRRLPWYTSIDSVAELMGLGLEEATRLADECAELGLARHDLHSSATAYRHEKELPHSVSLDRKGWEMMWTKIERRPPAGEIKPAQPRKRGRKN